MEDKNILKSGDIREILLGEPIALGYHSQNHLNFFWDGSATRPNLFRVLADTDAMLSCHAVVLPLEYYKGGIAGAEIKIKSASTQEVGDFAKEQFVNLMTKARSQTQRGYDFGWVGAEINYAEKNGLMVFDYLEDFHPRDVRPLMRNGKYIGFRVKGVWDSSGNVGSFSGTGGTRDLWAPLDGKERWYDDKSGQFIDLGKGSAVLGKAFWFGHRRKYNPCFGVTQLYAAWSPWRSLAGRDGAEEITRMAFYRFAVKGPMIRFPAKNYKKNDGSLDYDKPRQIAREMGEKAKAGAVFALPNTRDENGDYEWTVEFPESTLSVDGLLNYEEALEKKISKAIGVPPELLEASQTGSGYSGREIPLDAFLANQQENINSICHEWYWQIVLPLVKFNFGPDANFEFEVENLRETRQKQSAQAQGQGKGGGLEDLLKGMGGEKSGKSPPAGGQTGDEQGQKPEPLKLGQQGPEQIKFGLDDGGDNTVQEFPMGTVPEAVRWGKIVVRDAPHVRIVGPTQSGKSTLAMAIVQKCEGKVFVIDPVWVPGNWGGLPAVTVSNTGGYEPIADAIDALMQEMYRRGKDLQQGKTDFERLTIVMDEVPDTVSEVPEAGILIRRLAQRGRHCNMHLIGIGQSDRVNSWGIQGYGDVVENFTTIYLGSKAINIMPELTGISHPAVMVWRGKDYWLDMTEVPGLAAKPVDMGRLFRLPMA